MTIKPWKKRVMLHNCPVGLFLFGDTLAVMTEYSTSPSENARVSQRDAYIIESGEYFWGGTNSPEDRARLMVTPCNVVPK